MGSRTTHLRIPLLLLLSIAGVRATAAAAELRVSQRARSLQPGEVVLLEVESSQPLTEIHAEAFGETFHFYSAGDGLKWAGLVGIDLNVKPGSHTVRLTGTEKSGSPVAAEHPLKIVGKDFPTRQLTVDEKFVTPPKEALARIAKESEMVKAVLGCVTPERYWRGGFVRPVPGQAISAFGNRSVYNGQPRSPHAGTDFRAASGTPIRAPNAGKVVLAADLYYSGNTVIIDHGLGLFTYFAHLSSFAVRQGTLVKTGEVVGNVGATGRVTGPHLHWSVRLAGARVDPLSLLSLFSGGRRKVAQ